MTSSSRQLLRLAAILASSLVACAKGATTLDEDAAQSPSSAKASTASDGSSGSSAAGLTAGTGGSGNSLCGNRTIDPGEDCDFGDMNGVTCMNLGFSGGQLTCDPITCTFETSMCTREPSFGSGGNGG